MRQVTFETQSRMHGAWRTIGIHDDRPTAVAEAERILAGKRTPAVRVVQVIYDAQTATCTEYTVFRATTFDQDERARRQLPDQGMFAWGEDGRRREPTDAGATVPSKAEAWIERHWPSWAPDWATTALALSFAVLLASIMFRWSR